MSKPAEDDGDDDGPAPLLARLRSLSLDAGESSGEGGAAAQELQRSPMPMRPPIVTPARARAMSMGEEAVIVGIAGGTGSGKSTIVAAICAALQDELTYNRARLVTQAVTKHAPKVCCRRC